MLCSEAVIHKLRSDLPPQQLVLGVPSSAVLNTPGALSPGVCAILRDAIDQHRSTAADSVDGAPSHELNLSRQALQGLIGHETRVLIWRLAAQFAHRVQNRIVEQDVRFDALDIFGRRYCAGSRPWMPFHCDR